MSSIAGICDFSDENLARLIYALVWDEIRSLRGGVAVSVAAQGNDVFATRVRKEDDNTLNTLGLDSLELIGVTTRLNELFQVSSTGFEDLLLGARKMSHWKDILLKARVVNDQSLTFRTSGSTGEPKRCTHTLADLTEEAQCWLNTFGSPERLISLVSPHHLYGFMFTALLPCLCKTEVVDLWHHRYGILKTSGIEDLRIEEGDWLIATPFMLSQSLSGFDAIPPNVLIISSTEPMGEILAQGLTDKGFGDVIDIYGCSEYGGIGYRRVPYEDSFNLLPGLDVSEDGDTLTRNGQSFRTLDRLQRVEQGKFKICGRRDKGLQIAGINVFPENIAQKIKELPYIRDCKIEIGEDKAQLAPQYLKAVIVPEIDMPIHKAESELRQWCGLNLNASEKPASFVFVNEEAMSGTVNA